MLVRLKPISERKENAQKVIERLRKEMPKVPGGRLFLMADQDLQLGGGGRDQTTRSTSTPCKAVTWPPARVVPESGRRAAQAARADRHRCPRRRRRSR
jgi:hypothetical protein